jgi:hypothetical protein
MISYRNDRESCGGQGAVVLAARGPRLTRRRVVDYCRVTAAL